MNTEQNMKDLEKWREVAKLSHILSNIDYYERALLHIKYLEEIISLKEELQKRIDESLDFLNASNHYNEYYVSQAIKILKGE